MQPHAIRLSPLIISLGYERTMHTPEGRRQNRSYNENIFEQTIRWAMVNQLRNPGTW